MTPTDQHIEIVLASPPDYQQPTAEIFIQQKFVALVSCENGLNKPKLEFPGLGLVENQILRIVDLELFLEAVDKAVSRLRAK